MGIRTFHVFALTITKLIDFYSQCIFLLFFCLPTFLINMNQNVIAKLTLPHGNIIRESSLCSGLQKILCFQYKVLDKNTNAQHFLTTVGCLFSKCVHCDMRLLGEKNSTLLSFLDGFGIAVPVFCYKKIPTQSSIV